MSKHLKPSFIAVAVLIGLAGCGDEFSELETQVDETEIAGIATAEQGLISASPGQLKTENGRLCIRNASGKMLIANCDSSAPSQLFALRRRDRNRVKIAANNGKCISYVEPSQPSTRRAFRLRLRQCESATRWIEIRRSRTSSFYFMDGGRRYYLYPNGGEPAEAGKEVIAAASIAQRWRR